MVSVEKIVVIRNDKILYNMLFIFIHIDHEDLEDYIPPPAVAMSGRESRGKSPVTPSYRKPPPYVSP